MLCDKEGTSKGTYHFPKCNIFFTFSRMGWDKLRKILRIFCHICALLSACACLLRYWRFCVFIPHPLYFSFFCLHVFVSFCTFPLNPFFSTFLSVRLPPPTPSFFALLYCKTAYGYITPNHPSQKKTTVFTYTSLVQHSPLASDAL
jgi:hypothetical protein